MGYLKKAINLVAIDYEKENRKILNNFSKTELVEFMYEHFEQISEETYERLTGYETEDPDSDLLSLFKSMGKKSLVDFMIEETESISQEFYETLGGEEEDDEFFTNKRIKTRDYQIDFTDRGSAYIYIEGIPNPNKVDEHEEDHLNFIIHIDEFHNDRYNSLPNVLRRLTRAINSGKIKFDGSIINLNKKHIKILQEIRQVMKDNKNRVLD